MSALPLGSFELALPRRVVFGWGRRAAIGELAQPLGRRALLVTGSRTLRHSGAVAELVDLLRAKQIATEEVGEIHAEPEVRDVDALVTRLRMLPIEPGDFLIGLGGGSALDLAKAAAALAPQPDHVSVLEYLEGVGTGRQLVVDPLPFLAIPTTGGTGTEATKNAVISSTEQHFKKSLRDPRMLPSAVLIDPELAVTTPSQTTAHTGLDAITQLIESHITRRANPWTSALVESAIGPAIEALPVACAEGTNRAAREALAYAAFVSGVSLANAGLGLAHGVAAGLGTLCGTRHGLACAVMLPVALRVNRAVSQEKLARLAECAAERSFASPETAVDHLVATVVQLLDTLHIPTRLRTLGVTREQLPELVRASQGNSMNGNPRTLTEAELLAVLEEHL